MSLLFGGGQKTKPQFTGLSAQTSTSAIAITIGFGKNRSSHNIIWQDDFQTHKKKQKAGKGGPSTTTYTYSASFILALGWGPGVDVVRVWKDQSKLTAYADLGFSLFAGATPQAPWGYLDANHPDEALGYPGIAYLAVANYDLGQGNQLPQHSFEIEWPLVDTQVDGAGDADPAQIVEAYLTNTSYGVGFDFTVFNQDTVFSGPNATTTGDAAYQTYCRAMGFGLSPVLTNQEAASEALQRWAKLTNTAIVWNGYELKLIPHGSETVTAHGVTYLPNFPVLYELNDSQFLGNKNDPITFDRTDPADAKNGFSMVISNRDNEYNELPVSWRDQGLIDQFGYRKADQMEAREVCEPDMAAIMVSLIGQRIAYIRNKFSFKLGPRYNLLEPMDVVECTDAELGVFNVQIVEIEEDDDGNFDVVAEEYHGSVTVAATTSAQPVTNVVLNTGVDPGPVNPPIIFEAPRSLTKTEGAVPEIWAAVSGGDGTNYEPQWGGCYVWISTDDITYNQIGTIDAPARMGKLTAILPSYALANPDTVNTLAVSLDMSGGELEDATADDAEAGYTLCYIDGEFLSFELATATGTFDYDLDNLYRGLYGSTGAAHAIGDDFARLDTAIFKYAVPAQYIGKLLYLKFQSFNQFGSAVQDLAACVAYTFTPSGASYGTGTGGVPAIPTGLAASPGVGMAFLSWNANGANDDVTAYEVWRAAGTGAAFGTAAKIATVNALNYTDTALAVSTGYTYFLKAVNAVGASTETAGVDLTTSATPPQPYGFAFGPKTPVVSKILAAFDTPIAWTLPASLTDSQATIVDSDTATAAAPSAQTDFDIQSPPGSSIGTMRFAAASLTATFINAVQDSVPIGQMLYIVAPANLNGIAGAIAGSIKGTR